ncbi:MAG: P-II family nitrogen regulator [Armatimonadota bacterium]
MTKIEAVIRPEKLDDVKAGLDELGITGITVMEVRGAGQQRGYVHRYRGAEYRVNLLEKLKLETVVPDHVVDQAVEVIVRHGRTGEVGDGKIFLVPVCDAVRVRTGERGESAIR